MKRHLVLAALSLVPSLAWANSYEIDPVHSSATFSVRHLMVSNVKGTIGNIKGTVVWDEKDLAKSKVEATLDASTIDTKEPKRDGHLKSPDFLDVAKYPTITFKSKKVTAAGAGYRVAGDLTLHGVTKEAVLEVEKPSAEIKDPFGMFRRGLSASTTINRKDYGLTWNKALEGGGVMVGDEVKINLEVEITRPAAAAPAAAPAKK